MRKILFTFLLLISLMADAQINPKEGFIITNQKDTIYGLIDYRSNTVNAKECTFKANNESEYKTYAPGQISAYRFKETGKFYISKKYENEDEVFAEFLISGMMNLYRVEMGFRKIYTWSSSGLTPSSAALAIKLILKKSNFSRSSAVTV